MGAALQHQGSSRRGRGRRRAVNRKVISEINVTPFVDVMLVLLIIFMVTSPMLATGVQVNLPKENSPAMASDDEPLAISVNKKGEIFLNKHKIKLDEITPKLKAIASARKGNTPTVLVRGDQTASYGMLMAVISRINQAGLSRISLETDAAK